MLRIMKNRTYVFFLFICLFQIIGCGNIQDKLTTLEVIDNNRHYYPTQQGKELVLVFPIKNSGDNSFVLKDIIVTCGCIVPKKAAITTIPAGKVGNLVLTYDSTKNIGFVKHSIAIYGNLEGTDLIEITFDTNVVPDADYTRDYEELFQQRSGNIIKDAVDGTNNKNYYLDI